MIDRNNSLTLMTAMMDGNTFSKGLIARNIATLRTLTRETDARAHATAMAILHRSLPSDMGGNYDCSQARALIGALGKGGRANAMVAWFERHTNIRFTYDKKALSGAGMLTPKQTKMYSEITWDMVEQARLNPYWTEVAVEGVVKPGMNDAAFVAKLAALLAAAGKDDADIANPDNLALIAAAQARVKAHTSAMNLASVVAMKGSVVAPPAAVVQ